MKTAKEIYMEVQEKALPRENNYTLPEDWQLEAMKVYAAQAIDAVCDHLKDYEHEDNFPDGPTEITDDMLAVGYYGDGRDGDVMVWIDKQSILKLKEELK